MSKVLAIDIGTASVSAAVAQKHANGKFFVCDVWRLPYDASDNHNASRVLFKNLEQVFFEASKFHPSTKTIAIGFSSPLHLEKTINAEFIRPNPEFVIGNQELERAIQTLSTHIKDGSQSIAHDILESKVNGYIVEDSIGHKGEILEIKANLLMLAASFKNHLDELRDKFFPVCEFKFFSDSTVLKKAVLQFFSPKEEFLIFDIGGEVSVLGNYTFPFGLRVVERKFASFFPRFYSGNLDYVHERTLNKILKYSAEVLRSFLKEYKFGKIFLTGAGANIPLFFEVVQKSSTEVKKLEAQDFNKFFLKLSPLSGGEDAVLAALISIT